MDNKKEPYKKILLMGLDNSGKTTILLCLRENTNLLSYLSLKPTKGLNIENFDKPDQKLSLWDFGGQEEYREGYLSNFSKYTTEITKLIFVIDVQDINRYEKSLLYFQNIIQLLEKDRNFVEISVFLHKYDPNLTKQEKFKSIDDIINKLLIKRIIEIIPASFCFEIFRTSIYTIFEKGFVMKKERKK